MVDTCLSVPSTASVKPPDPSVSVVTAVSVAPLIDTAKLIVLPV